MWGLHASNAIFVDIQNFARHLKRCCTLHQVNRRVRRSLNFIIALNVIRKTQTKLVVSKWLRCAVKLAHNERDNEGVCHRNNIVNVHWNEWMCRSQLSTTTINFAMWNSVTSISLLCVCVESSDNTQLKNHIELTLRVMCVWLMTMSIVYVYASLNWTPFF